MKNSYEPSVGEVIDELAKVISEDNEAKGFWDNIEHEFQIPRKLVLIHDEVSEAVQVHRSRFGDGPDNKRTGMTDDQEAEFSEELADIVIRALDLAGFYKLPVGKLLVEKLDRNRDRPPKHGKRY